MSDEQHGKQIGADINLGYAVHHHNLPATNTTLRKKFQCTKSRNKLAWWFAITIWWVAITKANDTAENKTNLEDVENCSRKATTSACTYTTSTMVSYLVAGRYIRMLGAAYLLGVRRRCQHGQQICADIYQGYSVHHHNLPAIIPSS